MTNNKNFTNTTNEKGGINAMTENLRIVKNVAIVLLEVPVKVRKLSLSNGKTAKLINHPILPDCGIINAPEDKEQPFYSIMSSDANMQKAIQRYKGFIEEAENIDAIFLLINRPYRLQFLELIQRGLSPDEMGELLAFLNHLIRVGNETALLFGFSLSTHRYTSNSPISSGDSPL